MAQIISNLADVRPGDLVTYRRSHNPGTYTRRATLAHVTPGVVVVNAGGSFGTPVCVTEKNFVSATRPTKK